MQPFGLCRDKRERCVSHAAFAAAGRRKREGAGALTGLNAYAQIDVNRVEQ